MDNHTQQQSIITKLLQQSAVLNNECDVPPLRPGDAPVKAPYRRIPKKPHDDIMQNKRSSESEPDSSTHDLKRTRVEEESRIAAAAVGQEQDARIDEPSSSKGTKFGKWKDKKEKRKEVKGMNTGSARFIVPSRDAVEVCHEFAFGKCTREDCKYPHDMEAYMASKEPDIGPICFLFRQYGKCRFGPRCRYASDHTVKAGEGSYEQVVDEIKFQNEGVGLMQLNNKTKAEIQEIKHRKFESYDDICQWADVHKMTVDARQKVQQQIHAIQKAHKLSSQMVTETATSSETLPKEEVGAMLALSYEEALARVDQEILDKVKAQEAILDESTRSLRQRMPHKKKTLDVKGKLYLAPLTTVGNLPFRRLCKKFGVDITCSEMAVATSLIQGSPPEWALLRRHPSEDIFGVQISAHSVQVASKAVAMIDAAFCNGENGPTVDFVDLNCGCPIDVVTKVGAGSTLLDRKNKLLEIVLGMNRSISVPVTVKLRTGITEKKTAHRLVPLLKGAGASLVTLHGRNKEQRYTKLADWDYINECATVAGPDFTFFGNGDVFGHQDYYNHLENAHNQVSGIMIGRGALVKPWIFTEIKERRVWDIRSSERLDIFRDFCSFGLDYWGSDTQGVNITRRFLLEWMSFTHRYIPAELLEVLPQKFNERPPPYYGRDDLETLLASPSLKDWIKISEMLLGPCPANFNFVPKHKANAYASESEVVWGEGEG